MVIKITKCSDEGAAEGGNEEVRSMFRLLKYPDAGQEYSDDEEVRIGYKDY